MPSKIHWKKKLISRSYAIYSSNQLIGQLREKVFSQTSTGELNDKEYKFITSGFFKQVTSIVDTKENKKIGEISYGTWMTKATFYINNKTYYWKYDNLLNTKWSVYNEEETEIKYYGSYTNGIIEANTDDSLLLLSGLYVKNYYLQTTIAVMIAVFIPVWITVLH